MVGFGHLSVDMLIEPFLSAHMHPQNHSRCCSRLLHSDTFLFRSGSSHFRTQVHLPKVVVDLLPESFIWTPFCLDLDQAILEAGDASPKPQQI